MKYLKYFSIFESIQTPDEIRIRFTEDGLKKFYKLLEPSSPEHNDSFYYWEDLKDVDGLSLYNGTLKDLFRIENRTYFLHYDKLKKELYLDASEPNYYPTISSRPNFQYSGNPSIYFKFDKLEPGGISDRGGIFEIVSVR